MENPFKRRRVPSAAGSAANRESGNSVACDVRASQVKLGGNSKTGASHLARRAGHARVKLACRQPLKPVLSQASGGGLLARLQEKRQIQTRASGPSVDPSTAPVSSSSFSLNDASDDRDVSRCGSGLAASAEKESVSKSSAALATAGDEAKQADSASMERKPTTESKTVRKVSPSSRISRVPRHETVFLCLHLSGSPHAGRRHAARIPPGFASSCQGEGPRQAGQHDARGAHQAAQDMGTHRMAQGGREWAPYIQTHRATSK